MTEIERLQDYLSWILAKPTNVFWLDYVKDCKDTIKQVSADYIYKIEQDLDNNNTSNSYNNSNDTKQNVEEEEGNKQNVDLSAFLKRVKNIQIEKQLQLAQQGMLRDAPTIFRAKAQYGLKDGSEQTQNLQINLLTAGLSDDQLSSKIGKLLESGDYSMKREQIQASKSRFAQLND